jgi:hypothetical protein
MATAVPTAPRAPKHDPLDFLVDKLRHEDEDEVRRRLQRFVIEAVSAPIRQQYEAEASLNYQCLENDFYTADELNDFAERGQPPTKRNEVAPIMERLAGQFIQTRQSATFLGRNTPADDTTGAIAQDYQRHNDQLNQYEFEEQDLAWDGLVGGVGWLKSYIKKNEMGEPYKCTRAKNPFHVFPDPCSTRYDPNEDAKYIVEGAFMDVEDTIEMVPDQEDAIRTELQSWNGMGMVHAGSVAASLQNESFLSTSMYTISTQGTGMRRRVRPWEIWYKRKIRVVHLYRPDGVLALPVPLDSKTARQVVRELGNDVIAVPGFQDRMYVGILLGDLVLHHDLSPHHTNLFPYIPFYSGRRKNGAPLPLASRLIPINESINKRESKALALLTNRQIIAERNALEDPDEAAETYAQPDGVTIVKEGALKDGRVIFKDNLDIGQAQLALLQEDKDAIRRVSGQGNEAMGMPSEVRSGTGIARKQMMSNLIVTPVHNNLRRTRTIKAKLDFAYMKQYLTEAQAFQLTDDPNAARTVQVTKGHLQAIKEFTYDIVVTEMKDYATLREQQAEMLLQVLPQLAQHGLGMVKLGIQLTEFRDKEALIRMAEEQVKPGPVIPKINLSMGWPDLAPEVQAYLAMVAFQSPELAEAIMKQAKDPAFVQKLKTALIQTQIKEGTRASVEHGKLDLQAMSTAVDGRLQLQEYLTKSAPPEEASTEPEEPMV